MGVFPRMKLRGNSDFHAENTNLWLPHQVFPRAENALFCAATCHMSFRDGFRAS
jgi:hypothetical protein